MGGMPGLVGIGIAKFHLKRWRAAPQDDGFAVGRQNVTALHIVVRSKFRHASLAMWGVVKLRSCARCAMICACRLTASSPRAASAVNLSHAAESPRRGGGARR